MGYELSREGKGCESVENLERCEKVRDSKRSSEMLKGRIHLMDNDGAFTDRHIIYKI